MQKDAFNSFKISLLRNYCTKPGLIFGLATWRAAPPHEREKEPKRLDFSKKFHGLQREKMMLEAKVHLTRKRRPKAGGPFHGSHTQRRTPS